MLINLKSNLRIGISSSRCSSYELALVPSAIDLPYVIHSLFRWLTVRR